MKVLKNYINGKLVDAAKGNTLDVINPATGEVFGSCPASTSEDVSLAVEAASAATKLWANLSAEERSAYLEKIANGIEARLDEFALAECMDTGKPLWLTKSLDIPRAISNFRFFAHAITQFSTECHETNQSTINFTLRQPIGVVACISPWNLPLYLFSWKVAPALAAGNTVIAKPSEVTPYTAYLLSEVCAEVLPAGVFNILHGLGHEVGDAINLHPKIKAISFTGSTKVGQHIATLAAPMFKKLSLEMGGKNPNIIFADAPYEKMLQTTIRSSFLNQGQICLCGSRILVESSIYQRFVDDFVAMTKALVVGDPLEEKSRVGAIVSKVHYEKILSYIALAKEEGGTILAGGNAVRPEGRCQNGLFIEPTIIAGLSMDCRTNQEEIFGPVVTIMPFHTEEEAIQLANNTSYGLACSIWTSDMPRTLRMSKAIESGIVWINTWLNRDLRTPFGGVKNSGVGREGGLDALRFFTEAKNICMQY